MDAQVGASAPPAEAGQSGRGWLFWTILGVALLASRLMHVHVLWADEDYHLAAGVQLLHGKMLYRDVWYDKPPLAALLAAAFGAQTGVTLRIVGTLLALGCCALAFRLPRTLWTKREGYLAAAMLAYFLIADRSPGVIPLEPDSWMIAPHLAAMLFAFQKRPWLAGAMAGVAFLLNVKGLLVLAACLVVLPSVAVLGGFAIPVAVCGGWLGVNGALASYVEQVWTWGLNYASHSGSDPQARRGFLALLAWIGWHNLLIIQAGVFFRFFKREWRFAAWIAISLIAVALGGRFAPRYFLQLLPALLIPAARGLAAYSPRRLDLITLVLACGAALPISQFITANKPSSFARDTTMDRESRAAADIVSKQARPGDTIFVWGYRPNVVAYTRMPVASRIWDSQPLTGVPADRHLSDSRPVFPELAGRNRVQLAATSPTFIVDGLSRYNPQLDIHRYADLSTWLGRYCPVGEAGLTVVYRLCR